MTSGEFNVATAVLLVLGGVAALMLATVIALGGYGRPADREKLGETAQNPLGAGGALADAEGEILLDTSEPASGVPTSGNVLE
jgi:hypothetical protein